MQKTPTRSQVFWFFVFFFVFLCFMILGRKKTIASHIFTIKLAMNEDDYFQQIKKKSGYDI